MRLPDLLTPDPRPDPEPTPSALHRRRMIVSATVVVGAALLAATLRGPRGSSWFTVLGLLAAGAWIVGGFLSGPIPIRPAGSASVSTQAVSAVLLGGLAFLAFLVADEIARHIPVLAGALDNVLGKADAGVTGLVLLVAVVNAVGEEVFFRGAVHAAVGDRRAGVAATVVYVAVTAVTFNPALILAAAVMGTLLTLERLSTRGIFAPSLTHVAWSILTLLALPR